MSIVLTALKGIPLIRQGEDLADIIASALPDSDISLQDDDIFVLGQKIVSKAEGRMMNLAQVIPGEAALKLATEVQKDPRLVELVLKDTGKVLRADRDVLVVARRNGVICINAGVDKSNVGGRFVYARLPLDSDKSASELRSGLERLSGSKLAVIVGDTYSRPLRVGQVEFAIGLSGIEPIVDYRGRKDLFGYELRFKYVGLADEVAAAAELVMGQGTEGIPVAIVRGVTRTVPSEGEKLSRKLLLGRRMDLFSRMR